MWETVPTPILDKGIALKNGRNKFDFPVFFIDPIIQGMSRSDFDRADIQAYGRVTREGWTLTPAD